MSTRLSLRENPDFLKLWVGQTVSQAGSMVGRFALPLIAVVTLDATPLEMGLLRIADILPALLFGLLAGVWVDRIRRRPLMMWADLARAVALAAVPTAAIFGVLRVELLYVVAVLVGILTILFDVAYQAYLPSVVNRGALLQGNARLSASNAVVEAGGFSAAGALVQWLTAPVTVLLDAASFLVSAASLALIRRSEPAPTASESGAVVWRDLFEGFRVVGSDRILRALALAQAARGLFTHMWVAMLLLFLTRDLQMPPVVFGSLFAIGGVSAFVGAFLAEPAANRLGVGPSMLWTFGVGTASLLLVPMAGGDPWIAAFLVGGAQCFDAAGTIFEIEQTSLIQSSTPVHLLGRVNACMQVTGWAVMLVGSLLGGILGEAIGVRATMWIGAIGSLPAILFLFFSPLRRLRSLGTV